jgi:hypothetical protein
MRCTHVEWTGIPEDTTPLSGYKEDEDAAQGKKHTGTSSKETQVSSSWLNCQVGQVFVHSHPPHDE